jgi:hypothetical protein
LNGSFIPTNKYPPFGASLLLHPVSSGDLTFLSQRVFF